MTGETAQKQRDLQTPQVHWEETLRRLAVSITREEISEYTREDPKNNLWHVWRSVVNSYDISMRDVLLVHWLKRYEGTQNERRAVVQVANYVNALKRGGLL